MFQDNIIKEIPIPEEKPIPPPVFELTDDQKKKILNRMEDALLPPPSLLELNKLIFEEEIDGRDRRARLVRDFCSKLDFSPKTKTESKITPPLELTDAQKEFIRNHISNSNVLDITKELFSDRTLTNLNRETRAVYEYVKTLNVAVLHNTPVDDMPEESVYKPPKTRIQCISKIEKYVHEKIDEKKLNQHQIKNVDSLISHLHVYRFNHQINAYDSRVDRELFESTFIRYVWPKASDLSSEEVDQFIILSSEVVITASIQKRIETLQRLLDDAAAEEKNDDNKRHISMSLVEAIGKQQDEYHQSIIRQQKLLSDVNVKRSVRIKDKVSENQSLVSLIEFWKNYENRQQLIALAELRKEKLKEEVSRIKNLDQLKAEIFGVGEDIINA